MESMKKVIFVIIFILVLLFGFYAYFILGNQARSWRGITQGEKYVSKMYSDFLVIGKNCQGEDSNSDGYITCNFRLKTQSGDTEKTITLQCPTFWKSFMATSCKEQGILVNQN